MHRKVLVTCLGFQSWDLQLGNWAPVSTYLTTMLRVCQVRDCVLCIFVAAVPNAVCHS